MPRLTDTVMILAAGAGRRMRPWTQTTPKPLLPVAGRPLLFWTVEHLERLGFSRIIVNAHHLADQIEASLEQIRPTCSSDIIVSREAQLLGTGGGIRQAAVCWPPEGAWIFNGDVVCDYRFDPTGAADGLMVVRETADAIERGPVWVDENRVTGLLDHSGPAGRPHMFTGIHYLSRDLALDLPPSGCVVRDGYVRWFRRATIRAENHRGFWGEIGTPEAWNEIRSLADQGRLAWLTGSTREDRLQ